MTNTYSAETEVLKTVFPEDGNSAFAEPLTWKERAKRIMALIKFLRREGDVYIVSRRAMKPERYFFVAEEKRAVPAPPVSEVACKNTGELPRVPSVKVVLIERLPYGGVGGDIKRSGLEVPLTSQNTIPTSLIYQGKLYFRHNPQPGSDAVIYESVPEARPEGQRVFDVSRKAG
jgi:hypothetical protein